MPDAIAPHHSSAKAKLRTCLRGLAVLSLLAASLTLPRTASALAAAELSVAGLQVDYATNPLGTDDTRPSLSWKLTSSVNGERQTAYRVIVASGMTQLDAGIGDVWDSGKVTTSDSIAIAYGGPTPQATATYHWKVQVWDANGTVSAWSPAAQWEMGLLTDQDWNGAQWISPSATGTGARRLRKAFTVDAAKTVTRARAYVLGLGFYELRLNGAKVGDQVLAPASTPYDRRALYITYDVTGALRPGANAAGLWLGNGYGPTFSQYGFRWTGPKQARLLLDVRYADGTRQTMTTDGSWKSSTGPITANDIYGGETYDARQEQNGWDQPGYDESGWQPVVGAAAPAGRLAAHTMPPLRVTNTLTPVKLTQPKPGVYIYDFGQNIAGWQRLRVQGPAGTSVRMRTAEEIAADGTLDTTTNRNAAATDTYTLAGTGTTETYEPRFTYHGFRYVEVTGYPQTPTLTSLDARVVHADVASTGSFSSSDSLLNQIWRNNRWTILNNSMSTPTDTPVRDERTPPGMDVQAYQDASTTEFAMDPYYVNYLRDLPPGTALPSDGGNAQQPDMGGAGVTLAWTLYQQYGDRATLAASYPAMKAFVDTNAANVPGYIWSTGFGDWCPPDLSANANGGMGNPSAGACTSEVPIVNTALSYLQAVDVAKAAAALGQTADAAHFNQLADAIKQAFNTRFRNADGAGYGDGRQTTSVLPLAFGMVPTQDVTTVGTRLVDTIMNKNGGHLDTGIFGTRYLMDALAAVGRTDVAMTILDQTTYPGFGFEIGKGATTSWEEWTYYSSMETHDHAMFAGINASLYTRLGGIQPTGPGYSTVTIAPQIPPGLQRVSAAVDTVRGSVASSWTVTGQQLVLDVTIPVGTVATVRVPNFGQGQATVSPAGGATQIAATGTETSYTVGSGTWHFTGSTAPAPSSALPGTWSLCAPETGTCSSAGTFTVAFGARGRFAYATVTNSVACSNTVFGDPVSGVAKACYASVAPPASGVWQRCAGETGTCAFAGVGTVAYGASGAYRQATLTGGTSCGNAVFGDPIPGTGKACYLAAPPPTVTTWTPCAAETKTCVLTGTHQVAYGAAGRYAYGTFTGDVACGNAVFGDPAPNQAKICYSQ